MSELTIKYAVNSSSGYAYVTGYEGEGTVANILSYYDGYPVTTIAADAFYSCSSLEEVNFSSTVKQINQNAFAYCSNLSQIIIPDNIESIGASAFINCTSAVYLNIGTGLATLNYYAFDGCNNLEYINSTNSKFPVISNCLIGTEPYYPSYRQVILGCKNSIIPTNSDIRSIASGAFENCNWLTSIYIPKNIIQWLNGYVFTNCKNLEFVTIAEDNPEYYTKNNCIISRSGGYSPGRISLAVAYKNWSIPEEVKHIGAGAFKCVKPETIIIPDTVTSVDNRAFTYLDNLAELVLSKNITRMGSEITSSSYSGLLHGCSSLEKLTIPFVGLTYTPDTTSYGYKNLFGNIFGTESTVGTIKVSQYSPNRWYRSTTDYYIPEHLTEVTVLGGTVCTGAFNSCPMISKVTIKDAVSIGSRVFFNCTGINSLSDISLPDNVYNYGADFFSGCTGLINITIPDKITSLTDGLAEWGQTNGVFSRCTNLASVKLNNVKYVGKYCFYNCTALTDIDFSNVNSTVGTNAFYNCTKLQAVHTNNLVDWCNINFDIYPYGRYSTAYWQTTPLYYAHTLYLKDEVCTRVDLSLFTGTTIPLAQFYKLNKIETLVLPGTITKIDEYAFHGCSKISQIYFNGSKEAKEALDIEYYNDPLYDAQWYYLMGLSVKYKNSYIQVDSAICDSNNDIIINTYIAKKSTELADLPTSASIGDCSAKINEFLAKLRELKILGS